MYRVTVCPPAPQPASLHFDEYQFTKTRHRGPLPVAYSDLGGMHKTRAPRTERSYRTPRWALDDGQLREVVLAYLENRFLLAKRAGASEGERLRRIRKSAEVLMREKKCRLEKWITNHRALNGGHFTDLSEGEYAQLFLGAFRGRTPKDRLREIEQLVQGMDSEVSHLERVAEIVTAIAYLSYRLQWPSTSIAEQLRTTAPAVRQILFRLNRAEKRMRA